MPRVKLVNWDKAFEKQAGHPPDKKPYINGGLPKKQNNDNTISKS